MIKVNIKKKDKEIIGFEVSGHAYFADPGEDIVCSAVSMLVYNTIDTYTDLLFMRENIKYSVKDKGNRISLEVLGDIDSQKKQFSDLILRKFELGMISIKSSYSKYIELDYMEV